MPVSPIFQAIIAATDSVSAPLRAVAAAFSRVGESAEHAGEHAEHAARHINHAELVSEHAGRGLFGLSGHVNILREHFGELHATIGEFSESLTDLLPALGALSAAGSVAGLFEVSEKVSEARSEFLKTTKVLGVGAEFLQQFNYAAGQVDVNTEGAAGALTKLNRSIAESASGENKKAAALFHHLGISLKDARGHMVNIEDVLPRLADAFRQTADPAMRTQMAMELFGRAGADLLPLLTEGSQGLDEMSERAKKLTYQFSEADNKGLEEYHRSLIDLKTAVGGFSDELGAKLAPVLRPVIEMATHWVAANRDWIATNIAKKVAELAHWIEHLDLKHVVEQASEMAHSVLDAGNAFGGLKVEIGAAAFLMGSPFLAPTVKLIATLKELALVVGIGIPSAFIAMGKSLVAGEGLWAALSAAFAANPFGLALTGAAAFGGAAYELWQHWGWVKDRFENLFKWFTRQDAWVQALITITAPLIGLPLLIIDNWTPIHDFFVRLWAAVGREFQQAWDLIEPIVDKIRDAAHFIADGDLFDGQTAPVGVPHRGDYRLPPRIATPPLGNPGAAGAPGANGRVQVDVNLRNLPPGSNVQVRGSGNVDPRVNTGQAHPDGDVSQQLLQGP